MKRILLYIALLCLSLGAMAQTVEMRQLFLDAPQEVLPLLSREKRIELLHNFDKAQKGEVATEVSNQLYGSSSITELKEDFMELKLDTQTSLQMRILPNGRKKYFVGMIFTSEVVSAQSVLVLYDEKWHREELQKYFQQPELKDFFLNPSQLQLNSTKQALGELGTLSYRMTWAKDAHRLRVEVTSFDKPFLRSAYPNMVELLKPQGVSYKWQRRQLIKER